MQTQVVRAIVAHARRARLPAGTHLAESHLAGQIGTSWSPVNAAPRHLARLGALQHDPNRGYFLAVDAEAWTDIAERMSSEPDDPLYLEIAADRLATSSRTRWARPDSWSATGSPAMS